MTAREANDKGYRIGNHSFEEDGYEVTMLMVYMLYVKLALIELALLNLMISLEPLRVLRTLRYTPRRGWNGSYASNISIVINNNDYID